jgi:vancomycin resistance protein YoaR
MKEKLTSKTEKKVLLQLFLAIPLSAAIFVMLLAMLLIGYEVVYADRIYQGVVVHGQNLSGMTLDEASQALQTALSYTYEGMLTFTYHDQVWEAKPIDLGFLVDPTFSAQEAYNTGRKGWLPQNLVEKGRAWFTGINLSPIAYFDERLALAYIQSIAAEIDQPVQEASLALENAEVVVKSGQVGLEVDVQTTLSLLKPYLENLQNGEIPLVVQETPPTIMEVGNQAELAREILSEPLILVDPADGGSNWSISPEELAGMLTVRRVEEIDTGNDGYQIDVNTEAFSVFLNSLAPSLSISPVNARFIFNDDTRQLDLLEPAVIGRQLDIDTSISIINERLKAGEHEIPLQFAVVNPAVTDDSTGEELGITELVHQETSYFYGSDAARVQNIETASAQFHGLLIPPGTTFSMADALGNVSLENGYAEALIIYGDQTIQGVGGGVCQVSTTLFRAAFFAGFPIEERHAHAYRVGYYEMRRDGTKDPDLAGLDATVYVPIVDLKFTNDTEHWLLMETYMGNYDSLTWKFYSTGDGRTVNWETTGPTNVIPAPEPLYRENPDLETGEIEKVDYAAEGAEITVTRTVYKGDSVYFSDSFYTKFQPWQEVWEYGPGTELPEQEDE